MSPVEIIEPKLAQTINQQASRIQELTQETETTNKADSQTTSKTLASQEGENKPQSRGELSQDVKDILIQADAYKVPTYIQNLPPSDAVVALYLAGVDVDTSNDFQRQNYKPDLADYAEKLVKAGVRPSSESLRSMDVEYRDRFLAQVKDWSQDLGEPQQEPNHQLKNAVKVASETKPQAANTQESTMPHTTPKPSPEQAPSPGVAVSGQSNKRKADTSAKPDGSKTSTKESKTKTGVPQIAVVKPQEIDQFFQSLRKQFPNQPSFKTDPPRLEIKVGREIAFRGIAGQAPEVNKISPETLAYLKAAIELPQADPSQQPQTDKTLNRAVTIKVNNEVVFKLSKGVIETNKLDPALSQQIAQVANAKTKGAPETTPNSEVLHGQTTSVKEQSKSHTPESSPNPVPAKTVPALDVVERELQKQPEGSVRQYLGQAMQALKLASQLAGAKAQEQVKELPQQAQRVGASVQQRIKDLHRQAVKLPQTIRDRQAAETALKLLDRYGTPNEQGMSYQAADYAIKAEAKNTYSILDAKGRELMRFKQNFLGPQVVSSQMSERQLRDFSHARSQIQLRGGVNLLAGDAATRIRQLQGLAPTQDVALSREARNIAAVSMAQNVLQALGRDRYENDQYRFHQRGDNLTISAKDGRGEILYLNKGQIDASLKPLDMSYLKQLDRQVSRELIEQNNDRTPIQTAKGVAVGD